MGGLNLLDCCRRFGVRRMIYSSSGGAGYGDTDVIPTPGGPSARMPASPYGITKVAIEQYVRAWGSLFGIERHLAPLRQHLRAAPGTRRARPVSSRSSATGS